MSMRLGVPGLWIASCLTLATAAGLLTPTLALAQKRGKEPEEVGYLAATELKTAQRNRFSDLYHGREPVRQNDRDLLRQASEWYIFRLTHPDYRNNVDETRNMHRLVSDVSQVVPAYDPKKQIEENQKTFIQVFCPYLQEQLKKVLKTEWPITHINAAIILDHLARAGYEPIADTLIEVLEDEQETDAAKLYALRGLKDLFALSHMQPPMKDAPFKDKKREARCIVELQKYLNRPGPWKEVPSDAELDGFRWVRREAIMGLALTRYPWQQDEQHKPVGVPVAFDLLRVCCKNGFNPEPSIKEQIEAAIGVCQLDARQTPGYNLDYAAYYLGWALRDFAMQSVADPQHKTQAWKYQALRLRTALDSLKQEADKMKRNDRTAFEYINRFVAKFDPILGAIEGGGQPDTGDLRPWLEQNAPQGKTSLFKDDGGKYQLKPPPEQQ